MAHVALLIQVKKKTILENKEGRGEGKGKGEANVYSSWTTHWSAGRDGVGEEPDERSACGVVAGNFRILFFDMRLVKITHHAHETCENLLCSKKNEQNWDGKLW